MFSIGKWTQRWKYNIKPRVPETYYDICTKVVKVESDPLLPGFGLRKKIVGFDLKRV
jgi:hypothetical protein